MTFGNRDGNLISGVANMANKSKIVGEVEVAVREMCEKGYNATHIGKQLGLAKDTIKLWAKKNGIELNLRLSIKFKICVLK